jgi:hypothetical protein
MTWPLPWDLTVPALISILTLILVHLTPQSIRESTALLGLVLIFLAPGYLLMVCLFPAKSDLGPRGRILMSILLSCLLAAFASLVLTFTPRGLQVASIATILCFFTLFLTAAAFARWSAVPRRKRFSAGSERSLGRSGLIRTSRKAGFYAVALLILLSIAISFAAFANIGNHNILKIESSDSAPEIKLWSASENELANTSANISENRSDNISNNASNNDSNKYNASNKFLLNGSYYPSRNMSENESIVIAMKNASATLEQKKKVVIQSVDEEGSDEGFASAVSAGIRSPKINHAGKTEKNEGLQEREILEKASYQGIDSAPNESDGNNTLTKNAVKDFALASISVLPASKTLFGTKGKEGDSSGNGLAKYNLPGSNPSSSIVTPGESAKGNPTQDQDSLTLKGTDAPDSTMNAEKTHSSGAKTSGTSDAIESGSRISKTDDSAKSSEINKEINSWVGSRSLKALEKSQKPYESKNIKYVYGQKSGKAILGRAGIDSGSKSSSDSKKPVKLGR